MRILTLNVNSLRALERQFDLLDILNKDKIDIALLTETKLDSNSRFAARFKKYDVLLNNRATGRGGGVAMLLPKNVKASRLNVPSFESIEALFALVELSGGINIVFGVVYHTESISSNIRLNDLEKIKNLVGSRYYIIGGDFNARHTLWHCNTTSRNGQTLLNWALDMENCRILTSKDPTFPNGPSYLDLFLIHSDIRIITQDSSINSLYSITTFSDHKGILLPIDRKILSSSNTTFDFRYEEPIEFFNYESANWLAFQRLQDRSSANHWLNIASRDSFTGRDIDDELEKFTNYTRENMNSTISKTIIHANRDVELPRWLSRQFKTKKHLRRWLDRHLKRCNYIQDSLYRQGQIMVRNMSQAIGRHLRTLYNQRMVTKLMSVDLNNHTFGEIKRFCRHKSNKVERLIDPSNNEVLHNLVDVTNLLARTFQSLSISDVSLSPNIPVRSEIINGVNSFLHQYEETHFLYSPQDEVSSPAVVTSAEIQQLAKKLRPKKSFGTDGIPNLVIKRLPVNSFKVLSLIFNLCIDVGYYPNVWKTAKIVPIHKPNKNPLDPKSYRPVALLPCVSKLFERVLEKRIRMFVDDRNLLPNYQFGFRAGHSTTDAVALLYNNIAHNMACKKITFAATIDLKNAFDTVWIDGLIWKLIHKFNFPPYLTLILHSYLSDRKIIVANGRITSNSADIRAGVPQGSVIAPILFILFMADLPLQHRPLFSQTSTIVDPLSTPSLTPVNPNVKVICFADDIIVFTASSSVFLGLRDLNAALRVLSNFLDVWKLKINTQKCEAIHFVGPGMKYRRKLALCPNESTQILDQSLNLVTSIRYLGYTLTQNLSMTEHMKKRLSLAQGAKFAINHLLSPNSGLMQKVRLHLYRQLIRPVYSYGAPIYHGLITKTMKRKVAILERRCLRQVTGKTCKRKSATERFLNTITNAELYSLVECPMIMDFLQSQRLRYLEKTLVHPNALIVDIMSPDEQHRSFYVNSFRPLLQYIPFDPP